MWLLVILLGFFQPASGSTSSNPILDQAKAQGQYYIQQIQERNKLDEHLWALTELSTSNPQIKNFIEKEVNEIEPNSEVLNLFRDIEETTEKQLKKIVFKTGSKNILIALLLSDIPNKEKIYNNFVSSFGFQNSGSINYQAICRAILQRKKISSHTLSAESFQLIHFFLISDKKRREFISEDYLKKIAANWKPKPQASSPSSLNLKSITLLQSLYLLDRYAEITPLHRSVFRSNLFPTSALKLRFYRYIDYSIYRTGRYDQNLELIRNSLLPLTKYLNDKKAELSAKQLLGVYLYSIGKLHQARDTYQQVLAEIDDKRIGINRTSLYNNLGITYLKLGEYDKYLELQFKALEKAIEVENYAHELDIYNNLFVYYKRLNDRENAIDYLNKALTIAQRKEHSEDLGIIYISLGSTSRKFNDNLQESQSYFAQAKKYIDPQNNTKYFIELLNEQAETYEQQKKFEQALVKHNRVLGLTPQKENNPTYIDALVNKALINLKMDRLQTAKKLIDQFSSSQLQYLDFEQIVKANTVRANYLEETGQHTEALELLRPTLEQVLERAQSSTDLQSGYWHIADEYLDAFDLAINVHLKQNQPEKAVTILDQLKTINDASIYQNPLVKASLLNESELTQYKNITNSLNTQRKNLLTVPEDKKFTVKQRINELELQKRKFDRKISSQTDRNSVSISEIQTKLSARKLILHITELNDFYYLARISRSGVSVDKVPFNKQTRKLFTNAVQQVANHTTNLDSLYAISELLGVEGIPDRIKEITVVPDSYLYQLPVDILPLKRPPHPYSYGATQYFIEKYQTHYITSLNSFDKENQNAASRQYKWNYIGYGISEFDTHSNKNLVPLPFAQEEVTSIKNRLSNLQNLQTFTNTGSKKTTFSRTAPEARILHLATHSEVSERDPLFSTIYLSKEDSANTTNNFTDQLFAYELFGLNLSNEMIMLNSCKSGSGSYIQGTGIMGFSRALQYAGANSLVLNIWSVNDMLASEFAIHFYEQLNEGKSKAEALQNTKRYFLASKNASPHFWGPYMLIGNTDPIVEPNRTMNLAMAGSFIFYFLLLVILSYLHQKGILLRGQS
ncbi:CHAT domain-containing protein [Fodinibius salsisoli]|uniref:CHAT domain-containing protein n=1 Tax=Fodinibius salsisoli TaxID=2820877 RepID=A0ABT3PPQ8_9BACT|nr:CHAT domain-containing protein [Fodinibius salsisoli]MCW9707839.1 CHAT domain-containing protein [Fodinibius salsisoli]